jgi:hypothetical protein
METLVGKERLKYLVRTLWRLGPTNVATVAAYRLALKGGLVERAMPCGEGYGGMFFEPSPEGLREDARVGGDPEVVALAEGLLQGNVPLFSHLTVAAGAPPDWFRNLINGRPLEHRHRHWSKMGDFDSRVGDIKTVWEVSRFDWTLILARAFCLSGDPRFLATLNGWMEDWTRNNPLTVGPNWKCGQETGLRPT